MTIQGVKSVESRTLKSFMIKLEPRVTHHDFCELIVDETNFTFTARLDGGETYSHGWGSPGDDFIQFLIGIFGKYNAYLFDKLADSSCFNFIDLEKTAKNMKSKVLAARYNRDMDRDDARELWDEIESMESSADYTREHFFDIFNSKFEIGYNNDLWSDEPWFEDFIEFQEDYRCRIFCEKVAPILAEVLKQEYKKSPEECK